ncbi:hypothetical protein [Flectobacillus roseus]|uniref:hypothetical protein n=1 Tax=Flectobacillus roseus TaxID=502259 RepID=UPI0024B74ED3|nr:hypothetical protein [Flectobacillus roseus]MDI9871318.1 hypothetical protein [Flectobacillus roseus]
MSKQSQKNQQTNAENVEKQPSIGNSDTENGNIGTVNGKNDTEVPTIKVLVVGSGHGGTIDETYEVAAKISAIDGVVFVHVDANDLPKGTLEELSIEELHKLYGLCNKSIMQMQPDDDGFQATMNLMSKLRTKSDSFDPLESFKQAFPTEAKMLNRKTPAEKAKERLEKLQNEEAQKVAEIAKKKAEEEKKKSGEKQEDESEESKE